MAVISLTFGSQAGAFTATWSGLGAADTGAPFGDASQTDKTVTVSGSGASFALKGSNDGSTWFTLHNLDATSTALSGAIDGIYVIKENPVFIRPEGAVTSVIITAR